MEVRPGYKQTDVGVVPKDWKVMPLAALASIVHGFGFQSQYFKTFGKYRLTTPGHFYETGGFRDIGDRQKFYDGPLPDGYVLDDGDLIVAMTEQADGLLGSAAFVPTAGVYLHNQRLGRVRILSPEVSISFLYRIFNSVAYRAKVRETAAGTKVKHTSPSRLLEIPVAFPPTKAEQQAIAEALGDADAIIRSQEQLLTKKRQIREGAMQELLTGKIRLPGFNAKWELKRISEIASPSSEKNTAAMILPVLTCSKHLGFMDSLGFFKNQVFSKDTSTYKMIRRGEIGYPANHIEEGSIGLQDLYDVALVSPIYVVFSVNPGVNSFFLHRVLKLDSYRQKFETATTSSVDRRGSLRWPVFSEITVNIPSFPEQVAIASVLADMDAEIATLEAKLSKADKLKLGMRQDLLNGKVRLV